MSGTSPPLYCTLILITMHSHQSYLNITTVTYSYEYSTTVDTNDSTLTTYRNRGLGKIVKCTLVYCIISLIVMQEYCTNTEHTGSLGYNSVCYITSRIGWVF